MTNTKDNRNTGTIDNANDRSRNVNDNSGGGFGGSHGGAGGAQGMGTQSGIPGATGTVGGIVDSVKEGAKNVADTVTDFASDAKSRVNDWTSGAGDMAQNAYQCATNAASTFGTEATGFIKKYPIQSVVVGFGIGLIIGRAVRT
jgi:ElaB/YqjD/DUF883 family membrane-anchored ribosome-binding protein